MENKIYSLPLQPEMQVEVILASVPYEDTGARPIYTIRMRYPRIIHGEIMTHRLFSRNARSSRAVPVRTMLLETTTIPFIPWHWSKNKPGMQGTEPLTMQEIVDAENAWLEARDATVKSVEELFDPEGLNIHKQNPNRLLEPFSWIDTLITSTDWDNFLWLRDHEAAEPHLRDLAGLVRQAIDNAEVQVLQEGEWHLPYVTEDDRNRGYEFLHSDTVKCVPIDMLNEFLLKLSAARCARISYVPFNGVASFEAEMERYHMLVTSDRVHASPTEHQAKPDTVSEVDYPEPEDPNSYFIVKEFDNPHLHGNLEGYIQARKLIDGERHVGR